MGRSMKSLTIIILGMAGFALLAILTIILAGGWIEDDLAGRSIDDLRAAGQDWVTVAMDGQSVTLTGAAPDADAAAMALEIVGNVWGVVGVEDQMTKP